MQAYTIKELCQKNFDKFFLGKTLIVLTDLKGLI